MTRIRILEVGQNPETLPTFANTQGAWVRFASQDVEGWAVFIYERTLSISDLEGRDFFVETSYENVQNIARANDTILERIEPLSREGNFLVQATIKNSDEDGVIYCSAGEFNFMIKVPIGDRLKLMAGAKLSMEVYGLSLWDEHA